MNIIWSKNDCMYCDKAKALMRFKNLPYEERNIEGGQWTMQQLAESVPGARSFPQIVMDGKIVGGFDELYTLLTVGELSL